MEVVLTETENDIINEIGGSSVVVFKGSKTYAWLGVLCGICRVDPDI